MPVFERLKKADINIKIVLSGTDEDFKRVSKKFDIKAKKVDIKARFFIADENQVLFMLSNNLNMGQDEEELGIWINSDFFGSSLAAMFDLAFKAAK